MAQENQIPRYDYDIEGDGYYTNGRVVFTRTEDGDYCRWEDVEAEMNRLNQENHNLRMALVENLRQQIQDLREIVRRRSETGDCLCFSE